MIAVLLAGLLHPLPQDYDPEYYQWCMTTLQQGQAYCCSQAGGVLNSGACIDSDSIYTPPPPTLQPHDDGGFPWAWA